ncbi:ribosome silencing factor [Senegalia massiliensis]|uniref:Ribosomal silencing factor RsfS n=1 Tax=Senegalia massiliensis TaxID=1720316 RepID=A0A845QX36_9CLOT|nr:ribosome silencing factor [Senegalia massiliensis]NBI05712.1 ribosome silencing factor [Senegalia massiliensis]
MKKNNDKLSLVINAADDKLAHDIDVLEVTELTSVADYFVILSGKNERQVVAIADSIEDKLSENKYDLRSKEGYRSGRWILLDYGDIIIHIFHKEDREFYNLERLWADGKKINIDNYVS